MVQRFQVEPCEDVRRDELLIVLILVFLIVGVDAIIGVGLGSKGNPLAIRHVLNRLLRARCRSVATDGTATITLEGLDDAARMKGVMLAVQDDTATRVVDRVPADGTRRVLVPEHAIPVGGLVDALDKRLYALFLGKLHGQTEALLVVFHLHGTRSRRGNGDVAAAAFGHREKYYSSKVPSLNKNDTAARAPVHCLQGQRARGQTPLPIVGWHARSTPTRVERQKSFERWRSYTTSPKRDVVD